MFSLPSSLSKHTTPTNPQLTPVAFKSQTGDRKKRNALNTTANAVRTWIPIQVSCDRLDQSIDIITEKAEALFYSNDYKKCIKVLDKCVELIYASNSIDCKNSIFHLQNFESRSLPLQSIDRTHWLLDGIERA